MKTTVRTPRHARLAVLLCAALCLPAFAQSTANTTYTAFAPGLFNADPAPATDARPLAPAPRVQPPGGFPTPGVAGTLPAPDLLAPGEFEWNDDGSEGSLLIVVSLAEQRAYVYRNDRRIAVSTISSGKPGNDTPTGVFPILQKKKMHRSNLYDDAPMPFMQRLTWDGIALHAGRIPGKPASHGCVRLPKAFAEKLFSITASGQTVVVSVDGSVDALRAVGLPDYLAQRVGSAATGMLAVNDDDAGQRNGESRYGDAAATDPAYRRQGGYAQDGGMR